MTNPIDAALMAKQAFFGKQLSFPGMGKGMADDVLTGAKRTAGGLALLGTAGAAVEGGRKLIDALTKKHDFNAMMDANPDLAEAHEDNPKFFNTAYTSLRRLNPTYAGDPLVAGGIMRQVMENPVNAGGIITSTVRDPEAGGRRGRLSGAFDRDSIPILLGQQDV